MNRKNPDMDLDTVDLYRPYCRDTPSLMYTRVGNLALYLCNLASRNTLLAHWHWKRDIENLVHKVMVCKD